MQPGTGPVQKVGGSGPESFQLERRREQASVLQVYPRSIHSRHVRPTTQDQSLLLKGWPVVGELPQLPTHVEVLAEKLQQHLCSIVEVQERKPGTETSRAGELKASLVETSHQREAPDLCGRGWNGL